jgi:hypothetical protein
MSTRTSARPNCPGLGLCWVGSLDPWHGGRPLRGWRAGPGRLAQPSISGNAKPGGQRGGDQSQHNEERCRDRIAAQWQGSASVSSFAADRTGPVIHGAVSCGGALSAGRGLPADSASTPGRAVVSRSCSDARSGGFGYVLVRRRRTGCCRHLGGNRCHRKNQRAERQAEARVPKPMPESDHSRARY